MNGGQIRRYNKLPLTNYGTPYISVINKTGAASVAGTLVSADTAVERGVKIPTNAYDICGVLVEDGKADGAYVRMVTGGICEMLLGDGTTAGYGGWLRASTDQLGRVVNTTGPAGLGALAIEEHVKEVGHSLSKVASGGSNNKILAFLHTL